MRRPKTPPKEDFDARVAALTPAQAKCYAAIVDFIEEHGFPPTLRELTEQTGLRSHNAVSDTLRILERKKMIQREKSISRGLRII